MLSRVSSCLETCFALTCIHSVRQDPHRDIFDADHPPGRKARGCPTRQLAGSHSSKHVKEHLSHIDFLPHSNFLLFWLISRTTVKLKLQMALSISISPHNLAAAGKFSPVTNTWAFPACC